MKVNKNWFFSQAATLAKTDRFSLKPTNHNLACFFVSSDTPHKLKCVARSHIGISQIDVSGSSEAIYLTIMPLYE